MGRLALGCGSVTILIAGIAIGVGFCFHQEKSVRIEKEDAAINNRSPVRPAFLRAQTNCKEKNPAAERLDHAMIEMANAATPLDRRGASPTLGYAVSYFAWHWRLAANDGRPRCAPDRALIAQLIPWLDRARWPAGNTDRNDLALIERLPPSTVRARGLALIGFLPYPPPQNIPFYDSRPLALQLLADQGRFASPWRDAALSRMEGDSAIGTSAAQVAVVTDPSTALPRLSKMMADKLSRARRVKASLNGRDVPVLDGRDANRLIELGYAMARGGASAQPYAQPVIAMLDQRIARAASPFGLFATAPTEFCRIARVIGGPVAAAADHRAFCAAGFKGGDGAPTEL